MPSRKNVHNTHISQQIRQLHGAVLDIVSVINRPEGDEMLIREAGIRLDRALFPPLVLIQRLGPIGVGELAARVGRDYSTISRQVAKLESLGLVQRQPSATDRRVSEASVTSEGRKMTDLLDAARERMAGAIFENWEVGDIADLVRLIRRFADGLRQQVPGS
jgi:DNA-binding MarR family transcriptional regulator